MAESCEVFTNNFTPYEHHQERVGFVMGLHREYADLTYGDFEVWEESTIARSRAEVRTVSTGKVVKRFTGETSAHDAHRWASDNAVIEYVTPLWRN